jgi:hypothetical protein
MNNRGGRRPGAGRPAGSKNQRSAEIARAAADSGITPIEVMLGTMRELWAQGTPEAKREASGNSKRCCSLHSSAPRKHRSKNQRGSAICRFARTLLERGRMGSRIPSPSNPRR